MQHDDPLAQSFDVDHIPGRGKRQQQRHLKARDHPA